MMMAELSSFTNSVLVLLLVIMLKVITSFFSAQQTGWSLFKVYCLKLSNKVNRFENTKSQQVIAGFIANIITLVPIVIILWLFADFIAVPWLWEATILYLALDGLNMLRVNKNVHDALVVKNKKLARNILAKHVLREVDSLSELGIAKASIEAQFLKIAQQLITTTSYFLLFGPIAALTFRLLLEMHYHWNIKLEKYHAFGKSSSVIVNILSWLPVRIFSSLLIFTTLGQGFLKNTRLAFRYYLQLNNTILLYALSVSIKCKLNGVAIYQGRKLQKNTVNFSADQPKAKDIKKGSNLIKVVITLLLIVLMTLTTALELAPRL